MSVVYECIVCIDSGVVYRDVVYLCIITMSYWLYHQYVHVVHTLSCICTAVYSYYSFVYTYALILHLCSLTHICVLTYTHIQILIYTNVYTGARGVQGSDEGRVSGK